MIIESIVCPHCAAPLRLTLRRLSLSAAPQEDALQTADSGAVYGEPQLAAPQLADGVLGSKPSTNGKPFTYNDLDFLAWWEVYPLKREKAAAFRAYRKVRSQQIAADVLLAAAQRYAVECRGVDRSKIKYPSGWLNDGRWDDEPLTDPVGEVEIFDHEKHLAQLEEEYPS